MAMAQVVTEDDQFKSKSFFSTAIITDTDDFSSSIDLRGLRDVCVQVTGNFGSTGAVTIYGSIDPADVDTTPLSGSKWVPVALAKNGNNAVFTAFGGGQLLDNYRYLCAGRSASGTGVNLTVRFKATID